jgi:2-oxoglutarate ferredoxin oxidoreductase subunit gamma
MRTEVRLAGFGGQGIVLAGYILGKAAAIYADKEATMTQSYGPEARGGACASNVVISEGPVAYPSVSRPDVLVLMSQESYHAYKGDLRPGVQVLYDPDLVKVEPGVPGTWVACPAMTLADGLGRKIVANIVMLGFLAAVTEMLPKDAMKEAILSSVPAHTREVNEKAFQTGYDHGLRAKGKGG